MRISTEDGQTSARASRGGSCDGACDDVEGRDGWRVRAEALHRAFVARRLSPGGAADLLAMTLFVDAVEEDAP